VAEGQDRGHEGLVGKDEQSGYHGGPTRARLVKVHACMKPLQARAKPCVRLSDGDELTEVAGGQGGSPRTRRAAPLHATVMVIATTVTTLEAQGEVATVTLERGWGRIAGRDETRTENVNRASAPQSSE
jgi:hypothetical protein